MKELNEAQKKKRSNLFRISELGSGKLEIYPRINTFMAFKFMSFQKKKISSLKLGHHY